VVHRPARDLVG